MGIKLKDVVKKLEKQGVKITYTPRKDGGINITSINGVSYVGRAGNVMAREIAGEKLSAQQLAQRRGNSYSVDREGTIKGASITYKKTKAGNIKRIVTKSTGVTFDKEGKDISSRGYRKTKNKKTQLNDEVKKQLKKTQRYWSKQNLQEKGKGRITSRTIKNKIESMRRVGDKTEEQIMKEVLEDLKRAEKYARGYAYSENVDGFSKRLAMAFGENNEISKYLSEHKDEIKTSDLNLAVEIIYNDELSDEQKYDSLKKLFLK